MAPDYLIEKADYALYQVKDEGRNRVIRANVLEEYHKSFYKDSNRDLAYVLVKALWLWGIAKLLSELRP